MKKNNLQENDNNTNELWWLLSIAAKGSSKLRSQELKQYGVSLEESSILFALVDLKEKASPGIIGTRTLNEPHATSVLLRKMAAKGLIKKEKSASNKRTSLVSLTKQGEKLYALVARREAPHHFFSVLNSRQRQHMKVCLEILLQKALIDLGMKYRYFSFEWTEDKDN